jgi:hypothetical protein
MAKEKSIETPELLLKGNIMCWEGTMIQLSNVSCVSASPLEEIEFPKLSILVILAGLILLDKAAPWGVLLMIGGGAWIYTWNHFNNLRKLDTVLSIVMNSGNNLRFIINNKEFLNKILQVLELIIIEGGIGNQKVSIDMRGCKFEGNASVLNDLNIS